jgi:hypothetical protein
MTDHMQTVQGRCPACGWTSLFLGDGGYVTCPRLECPNPSAADQLLHGEQPAPTPGGPVTDRPDLKVIDYWGPVCETGRHYPPHPGETCDDVDRWIAWRDQAISDMSRATWERFEHAYRNASLAGTAFAAAVEQPAAEIPELTASKRALGILAPDLAWDHRYRP